MAEIKAWMVEWEAKRFSGEEDTGHNYWSVYSYFFHELWKAEELLSELNKKHSSIIKNIKLIPLVAKA